MIVSSNRHYFLSSLPFGLLAILSGLFISLQRTDVTIAFLSTIALALAAVITPLAALMVLLVIAPLRTLIATEAPGQLPLDIGQITFMGFIIAYGIHRTVQRRRLVELTWAAVYIPLLAFLVIAGLSAFTASSLGAWFNEWLKWLQIVLIVVLVLNLSAEHQWQWLIFGLILSGLVNALVGIYEFLGGSGALHLAINERFFRAFGTFGQPNPFGGFMGLLIPVGLMVTLGYSQRLWVQWRLSRRISKEAVLPLLFYAASTITMLVGIVVSWSRGAWLGIAAALVALALALPRKTWQGVGLLAALCGIVLLLWSANLLPRSVMDRITSATEEYFTFTDVRGVTITSENYPVVERLAHWQAALNMASSHPWFGVGLGNYEVVYDDFRLLNWHFPLGHAHNYYLNILAEMGIIGLLVYGKAWLGIIWLNWRVRHHPDNFARLVAIGLLGSWAYLSIHSLFDNLYVNNLFIHIGLMLAILAVLYNQTWRQHQVGI